ncbi:MAG TPA: PAS domain S-box protein [Steroidobacteraceae bacterium]|jgi:PAS domain S-box-containing protein|nr:PAS domain S-box protein [Steroidobacteraceae bacterium]
MPSVGTSKNPKFSMTRPLPLDLSAEGLFDNVELLRSITLRSPECIKVVALDGRLLQMNPAGLAMIETDEWNSVRHACVFDLIAPEHRDAWIANHERVCAGESLIWEFDIVSLEGTRRSMETHAAPIALSDGTAGQLAITRDVTERKNSNTALQQLNAALEEKVHERTRELEAALHRLQESERSFELLVDSVTDYALFMLDPTGRIVSWNAGAKRIKGYASEEIIGKNFECFYSAEDRAAGIPGAALRTAAREGRVETEGWRIRKDGTRFWANVIIDAIHSDGKLVAFAKITRDITEKRAAEAKLRQAQKMEAVGQFTGGAAHDFNNLLMAILGSLEILRKRLPNDPRMLALLDNAMQGAKRGSSLTQRMLAFARRQELKHEAVDLAGLVNNMMELLERSLGPTINIDTHFPREIVRVRTDANQLETALLNLAINSRDAMPSGGSLTISVQAQTIGATHPTNLPAGPYACLSVTDTGQGMDEATLGRATEPFFTTKGIGKGTGLGLSMVDGLTGQSGGKIMVQSQLGRGTTIDLWLPIAADADVSEGQITEIAETRNAKRQLCILAVDDDSLVLGNVTAMLEDLGHRVIAVGSGAKAIEAIEASPEVDLLLTDQAMPAMTGIQLIEAVRARRPQLPAILATGYAELPQGVAASIGRLSKPFMQRALADALASASANLP